MIEQLPEHDRPGTPPPEYLRGSGHVGFSDLPLDRDGAVRRSFLQHGHWIDRALGVVFLGFALSLVFTTLG